LVAAKFFKQFKTYEKMKTRNAQEMREQILRHGENLIKIFDLNNVEPVKLCKQLRFFELKANEIAIDWCNGENGVDSDSIDSFTAPILAKVKKLLGSKYPIQFNGDARGYSLKISEKIVRENNLDIYKDWGGYGIIAPDFNYRG
jgi:hypothetical protein